MVSSSASSGFLAIMTSIHTDDDACPNLALSLALVQSVRNVTVPQLALGASMPHMPCREGLRP